MRFILLVFAFFGYTMNAQINLNNLKNVANKAKEVINPGLSTEEVAEGLKEALIVGTVNSTKEASREGGFNSNLAIKIPFPEDAKEMKKTLVKFGMSTQVNKFEHALNEAAEDASVFAKDIFIEVVRGMTINDAKSILAGNDNAATHYLKKQTSAALYSKFKPIVNKSINKVNLTKYWGVLSARYNSIPSTKKVNTDLEDYVTNKAISGLFILIAAEEHNIRNNPKARVSEILQKVFK